MLLPYRLFTRKHVPDIVMTSDQKPFGSTTRAGIIVDLKDTCKTLDVTIKSCTERKIRLEILIKALFEEDQNLKGDQTGEDNANEEGTDASGDEEATTVMKTEVFWFFCVLFVLLVVFLRVVP